MGPVCLISQRRFEEHVRPGKFSQLQWFLSRVYETRLRLRSLRTAVYQIGLFNKHV